MRVFGNGVAVPGMNAVSMVHMPTPSASHSSVALRELIGELRQQDFDSIRFATYRAASKLRFIQKKVHLNLVDIWNIIESFRENGLNISDPKGDIKLSRVEILLSTIYHNLNKRLPPVQQIDSDQTISALLAFLLASYDRESTGRLRVFSIKVALATLCAGKLLDKLRYIFSQISDPTNGLLDPVKFADYLREVLALPTAVFEGPTFGYTEQAVRQCLEDKEMKVNINAFLDMFMNDPCPSCLMWLPLLHRMASVEHVFHPVICDGCTKDSFTGFRYKCQRCHNYQLCQDCFWRGRVSGSHSNQHEMKEYSSYKSPAKQLGHSIGKSLRCIPSHPEPVHPVFPEYPAKPLDLSNVVPSSPAPPRHAGGMGGMMPGDHHHRGSYTLPFTAAPSAIHEPMSASQISSSPRSTLPESALLNDEHKLIARYSAKLAANSHIVPFRQGYNSYLDDIGPKSAISKLEQRRDEMLREIHRLQLAQEAGLNGTRSLNAMDLMTSSGGMGGMGHGGRPVAGSDYFSAGGQVPPSSGVYNELQALRSRKEELESRMLLLQDSRHNLLHQLEELLKHTQGGPGLGTSSAMSTMDRERGSPSTSLSGLGIDLKTAFRGPTPAEPNLGLPPGGALPPPHSAAYQTGSLPRSVRSTSVASAAVSTKYQSATLQGDLLTAADSITNTMSSLVKELGDDEPGQRGQQKQQRMNGGVRS